MRKVIVGLALLSGLLWLSAANAGPLKPAPIIPPAAGEGNMPIGTPCQAGSGPQTGDCNGPRVDWIVLPMPGLTGFGPDTPANPFDDFLYLYQVESTSGEAAGTVVGDIRDFQLSSGTAPATPHLASFMGIGMLPGLIGADLDLFNPVVEFFGIPIGTATGFPGPLLFTLPTPAHSGPVVAPPDTDPAGGFANLDGPSFHPPGHLAAVGDLGPQTPGDHALRSERELNTGALPLLCGVGASGPEAGGCQAPIGYGSDAFTITWTFFSEFLPGGSRLVHGSQTAGPGGTPTPGEESTILWILGSAPTYGAARAADGAPFAPWSTRHAGGLDVPVPLAIPQPAPVAPMLLGAGILLAGLVNRWRARRRS